MLEDVVDLAGDDDNDGRGDRMAEEEEEAQADGEVEELQAGQVEAEPAEPPTYIDSSSPEVEFVRARTRLQPPRRPNLANPASFLEMFSIQSHRSSPRPSFFDGAFARPRQLLRPFPLDADTILVGDGEDLAVLPDAEILPGLQYRAAELGMERLDRLRPARQKALSPAPEGFARTLQEGDVAVCPNCGDELGAGLGVKQQIWVAKPCGHVRFLLFRDTVVLLLTWCPLFFSFS